MLVRVILLNTKTLTTVVDLANLSIMQKITLPLHLYIYIYIYIYIIYILAWQGRSQICTNFREKTKHNLDIFVEKVISKIDKNHKI